MFYVERTATRIPSNQETSKTQYVKQCELHYQSCGKMYELILIGAIMAV
jgi:hypothetical protein